MTLLLDGLPGSARRRSSLCRPSERQCWGCGERGPVGDEWPPVRRGESAEAIKALSLFHAVARENPTYRNVAFNIPVTENVLAQLNEDGESSDQHSPERRVLAGR